MWNMSPDKLAINKLGGEWQLKWKIKVRNPIYHYEFLKHIRATRYSWIATSDAYGGKSNERGWRDSQPQAMSERRFNDTPR